MTCNTSAQQAFSLQGSREDDGISVRVREARGIVLGELLAATEPLNITSAVTLWFGVATDVLQTIAPSGGMSMLLPSVEPNYQTITLAYEGSPSSAVLMTGSEPNTIAGGKWNLSVNYLLKNSTTGGTYTITYLPNGDVDPSSQFEEANELLAPTIELVRAVALDSTFDFWKLINWVLVSYYWMLLYNFGAIAPTTYPPGPSLRGTYFTGFGTPPNFSAPIQYPPTYNIFVNTTLFESYQDYLRNTLLPISRRFSYGATIPPFLPIGENNHLQSVPISFLTTYSCSETQIKGWVSVIISVLVADYALITGAYSFFVWIGGFVGGDKKDEDIGESPPFKLTLEMVKGGYRRPQAVD
jgi:hypothetical protein